MTVMLNTLETMTMKMEAAPTPVPVAGKKFDDAMKDVVEGDSLRCTSSVTFDGRSFTVGKEYDVIMGNQMRSAGLLTIKDDRGVEVPHSSAFGRIKLNDMFEKVTPAITSIWENAKVTPTAPSFSEMPLYERNTLLQAWKDGKNIEFLDSTNMWHLVKFPIFSNNGAYRIGKTDDEYKIADLEQEMDSLLETLQSYSKLKNDLNAFDVDLYDTFGEMSREDKAALLLAKYEGKKLQYRAPWMFGNNWFSTDKYPDTFADKLWYRVEPDAITGYNAEIKDLNEQIDAIAEQLSDLRDDEDEMDW